MGKHTATIHPPAPALGRKCVPHNQSTASQGPYLAGHPTSLPIIFPPARSTGPAHSASWQPGDVDLFCKNLTHHSRSSLLSLHHALHRPCFLPLGLHRCLHRSPHPQPTPLLGYSSLIPLCFIFRLLKTFRPSSKVFSLLNLAQQLIHCITSHKSLPLSEPQFTHLL